MRSSSPSPSFAAWKKTEKTPILSQAQEKNEPPNCSLSLRHWWCPCERSTAKDEDCLHRMCSFQVPPYVQNVSYSLQTDLGLPVGVLKGWWELRGFGNRSDLLLCRMLVCRSHILSSSLATKAQPQRRPHPISSLKRN